MGVFGWFSGHIKYEALFRRYECFRWFSSHIYYILVFLSDLWVLTYGSQIKFFNKSVLFVVYMGDIRWFSGVLFIKVCIDGVKWLSGHTHNVRRLSRPLNDPPYTYSIRFLDRSLKEQEIFQTD